jgi:hypothetical protein
MKDGPKNRGMIFALTPDLRMLVSKYRRISSIMMKSEMMKYTCKKDKLMADKCLRDRDFGRIELWRTE